MKRILILPAIIFLLCTTLFSQENESSEKKDEYKTIFGHDRHNGFYGALTIGYSEIDSKQAIIFGGRFELITGHSLGIGIGGKGFINESYHNASLNTNIFLAGGYVGLYFEPIVMPNYPVHISFPILLGAGGVSYINQNKDYYHNKVEDSKAFLVAEPGAELEMNLTRFLRLALGVSYRFTTPFDVGTTSTTGISSNELKGFNYMLTFKFGRF
jgi:hypothetical protein